MISTDKLTKEYTGLRALDGVDLAVGRGVELQIADDGVSLADVASAIFSAGFRLTRFLEREVDLEEAFLRLTKGTVS
ncbi:MAG: hypothetical protein HY717_00880 [Planctomycetes bacterium]|nr:hypothetical protein [Planctomycetota bacterium]